MTPAPKHISEKKRFSLIARGKSFKYAIRGMGIIFKTQHNFWIQLSLTALVCILGVILHITHIEWMVLVLAATAVLVSESFNTALEIDIDLTSPEYHPYARDTKDVAAGAVLISVLGALLIGCIIFVPKILLLVR